MNDQRPVQRTNDVVSSHDKQSHELGVTNMPRSDYTTRTQFRVSTSALRDVDSHWIITNLQSFSDVTDE